MSWHQKVFHLIIIIGLISVITLWCPWVFAGSISGFVTDTVSGNPITQLDLNLYDSSWNYVSIDSDTSGTGTYTFFNVPAGFYYVKANPKYPLHYRPEYWDHAFDRDDATLIEVPAGGDVTGIDFQLTEGFYIGGKILDSEFNALPAIDLNVYDINWAKVDVDASSDELGRYYIGGLPDGQFYVMANPIYAQAYIDQYFDHSNGPVHASLVTVSGTDTIGINFDLIDGTYIEGDLLDRDTGNAVPGIKLKAYNSSGLKMRLEATSQADGHYILGAYPSGDYTVRADPSYPDGYMDMYYPDVFTESEAVSLNLAPPKPVAGIDFHLPAGSYIRGEVFNESGTRLEDIKLRFYTDQWLELELTSTVSKSNGTYLSGCLEPGEYFVKAVPVYPQPYIDEYYGNAIEPENAQPVTVSLAGETTGIDFELQAGGYILGTITDAGTTNPIYDVDLDIYDDQWGWVNYSDHTNSQGKYLIGALPFGSYYVRSDPSASQGYIPEYFDDAFWPADAIPVTITETYNPDNVDFELIQGGKVTGRITDSDQEIPLEGIPVEVYTDAGVLVPVRIVTSRSDGTYISHGLPTGTYYFKAAPESSMNYYPEFFQEAQTMEDASPVSVTESLTTSGVNFTLKAINLPTPTPGVDLGVRLIMPQDMYAPGDQFFLNAMLGNPGSPITHVPLFVVLDVYGQYFFWPSWRIYNPPANMELDYSFVDLTTGQQIIPILPTFYWPDTGNDTVTGLAFYGAVLDSSFTTVVGELAVQFFGYGP